VDGGVGAGVVVNAGVGVNTGVGVRVEVGFGVGVVAVPPQAGSIRVSANNKTPARISFRICNLLFKRV